MHLFWMDGFNNGKTPASYIVFEPEQTEEDELSSMSSSASELTRDTKFQAASCDQLYLLWACWVELLP